MPFGRKFFYQMGFNNSKKYSLCDPQLTSFFLKLIGKFKSGELFLMLGNDITNFFKDIFD